MWPVIKMSNGVKMPPINLQNIGSTCKIWIETYIMQSKLFRYI